MNLLGKTRKITSGSFSFVILRFEQILNPDLNAPLDTTESQTICQPESSHRYGRELRLQISPAQVARQLLSIIVGLLVLSTIGQVTKYVFHHGEVMGLIHLFNVDAEANIPTFYSAITWLLCSLACGLISITHQQLGDRTQLSDSRLDFAKHWKGLAIIFCYLTLDEVCAIHELLIDPLHALLHASGLFYFTWVIPGAILVLVFVVNYLKFLQHLPRKTRNLIILAGIIFVTGALGFEMLGGWYTDVHSTQGDIVYAMIATTEEALEMLGVLVLLYALLGYISTLIDSFGIQLIPIRTKTFDRHA